ncbi:MAG: hypothetical protein DRR08_17395 [Candidatus Parabeggiatoa sp. nov. 2]|nr:MAG: hypothetical protein B6247_12885 [Beggiatoa sp. 4572_84]RKZ58059.1 MAG: hypothetical protein DRR08_17395 [Gammaproteobacteria bacterium]HEC85727.1 hypothetical protein [Thioploca sp.]
MNSFIRVISCTRHNTRQLTELCRQRGVPCLQVQNEPELSKKWFFPYRVVGVTAGTSTLDSTIEKVCQTLECMHFSNQLKRISLRKMRTNFSLYEPGSKRG